MWRSGVKNYSDHGPFHVTLVGKIRTAVRFAP
jgi:hypothetical protein